jgi:hypothetical protein
MESLFRWRPDFLFRDENQGRISRVFKKSLNASRMTVCDSMRNPPQSVELGDRL